MYINSIHIEKYQILEDLKIKFQIPKDDKNIVNIIAGVNGSGKTTLLEWILSVLEYGPYTSMGTLMRNEEIVNDTLKTQQYTRKLSRENQYINGIHSSPRVIYIPSNMSFQYRVSNKLDTSYRFENIIDTNSLLGNAEFFIKDYVISKERR